MKIKNMALCGLLAALLTLCSWLALPFGDVAVTLQTFALFLGLYTLGGKLGTVAFLVYLCLGIVGIPVFTGFRGGLGVLIGATGGYLWGLLAGCVFYLSLEKIAGKGLLSVILMLICYLCGTLWYAFAYLDGGAAGFWMVTAKCVLPFVLPDALKIWLAYNLSARLKRAI